MKKLIKNTYKEPMVIYLQRGKGKLRLTQRTTRTLKKKEEITVNDDEICPELLRMEVKGYISITDIVEKKQPIIPDPPKPEPKPEPKEDKKPTEEAPKVSVTEDDGSNGEELPFLAREDSRSEKRKTKRRKKSTQEN